MADDLTALRTPPFPTDAKGAKLAPNAKVIDPRDKTERPAIIVAEYEVASNLSGDPDVADVRKRRVYDCRVGVGTKDVVVWQLWRGLGTREPGEYQYHGNIARKPYIELLNTQKPSKEK